jgi:hypothetical protein
MRIHYVHLLMLTGITANAFKQENQAQFNVALCGLYCLVPYITTRLCLPLKYIWNKKEREGLRSIYLNLSRGVNKWLGSEFFRSR